MSHLFLGNALKFGHIRSHYIKYNLMSKFHVVPCQHGNARFRVDGRINGKRIRSFHRTKLEAEAECNARNVELFQHGQELASISASLRAEAIACQKRLDSLG